ncbi:TRAP transporter substrate-binding protein [Ornithinimicrobium avium]|uniref:Transporter n=1 Tax=Ornithinimicrobium avium TaxID=2283195 RepID=A0A345NNQ9_9MICO|nr:TRAP transporter substrate-binding protein [Ornithinimicrobium avium]AXH96667.1 transporter [Ornithinimicrobium avium]
MKFTKTAWIATMATVALGATACGGDGGEGSDGAEPVTLRVGHVFPASSPIHVAATAWADQVKEETDGRVEISVFPGSQLGSDVEMGEGLQSGTVECGMVNYAAAGIDPRLQLSFMPYIVTGYDGADALFYGDGFVANHDRELLAERGVEVLAFYENDFRGLSNSKHAVHTPADLEGLKLRVPETPMYVDMFKAWGAQPLAMAFSELYTALQQGTVDGQDNGLALTTDSQFGEVQSYMTLTNHAYGTGALACNEDTWAQVGDDQDTVRAAAETMSVDMRQALRDARPDRMETLKAQGVEVVELTDAEMAEFVKIKEVIWPQFEEVFGTDVIAGLREASEAVAGG